MQLSGLFFLYLRLNVVADAFQIINIRRRDFYAALFVIVELEWVELDNALGFGDGSRLNFFLSFVRGQRTAILRQRP